MMGCLRHTIESPLWAWVRDFLSSEDVLQMRAICILPSGLVYVTTNRQFYGFNDGNLE